MMETHKMEMDAQLTVPLSNKDGNVIFMLILQFVKKSVEMESKLENRNVMMGI